MKFYWLLLFLFMGLSFSHAQNSGNVDSLLKVHSDELKILKRIHLSGYTQPQFQWTEKRGSKYPGGDFGANINNRVSIRRSRLKVAYNASPFEWVLVTENTERGITLHDMYASYTFTKIGLKYTAGLFPRPFGFEQSYSTANHEGPERARFSTTLLPAEADLGCKLSYFKLKPFTFELGVYNGNATAADIDSYKDIVARISIDKGLRIGNLSGGVSFYHGSFIQSTNYLFETENLNGLPQYVLQDTVTNNKGSAALRQYLGADIQYAIKSNFGLTTLRAEWVSGIQPSSASTSDSPKSATAPNFDTYSRKFNALTTYFLHKIGKTNFQILIKYDWYDPNTDVEPENIGVANSKLNATDIKYSTLGLGINYYFKNMYIMAYYDLITNEKASNLKGFENDLKDNVFTLRTQFKF
ncbi:MAG: hypothetical protein IPO78_12655 [Saprospiraceae bacterium]|nr:hypothetical protein [Saprospiraceae bacterium]MBK9722450.1 hypothetical protein [Saprospiraceae bacterium]